MTKKKELETNPINDLFYAAMPKRKQRSVEKEEPKLEDDEYYNRLQEKKRARYEALKDKLKGWD